MFNSTTSDAVRLVGRADLMHPGRCLVCGSGNCDEGYVDLGVYFDYEGQMYLCVTCAGQVAEVVGCLLPDEAITQQNLMTTISERNAELDKALEVADERLRSYDSIFANAVAANPDILNGTDSSLSEDESEQSETNDKVVESVSERESSGESEAKKSTVGKRPPKSKRIKLVDSAPAGSSFDL